jgi:Zn finger protein HypA/HybF involved in hydrogenase expression
MKFTREDIDRLLSDRSLILVGDYVNTSTKSLFKCLNCDNEWISYVTNIIHKKYNCPKCAGNKPLSVSDIHKKLSGRDISFIGDYVNSISKSNFRCLQCHNVWSSRVSAVLSGQGCPECSGNKIPSIDDIEHKLKNRDIKFIGPYKNNASSTEWKCLVCEDHWMASPGNVLVARTGCPKCAEYGFNPNKSAWEYIFSRDTYIKYGITNDLERRLKEHSRYGNFTLIHSRFHEYGESARQWEKNIKILFGGKYVDKLLCPDGWTETLPVSLLEEVINSQFKI